MEIKKLKFNSQECIMNGVTLKKKIKEKNNSLEQKKKQVYERRCIIMYIKKKILL